MVIIPELDMLQCIYLKPGAEPKPKTLFRVLGGFVCAARLRPTNHAPLPFMGTQTGNTTPG